MDADQALSRLRDAFHDVPRPEGLFIRGTCRCCECEEHNATLAAHTPDSITIKELGNPGWDPICMASDAAFAYYLPAMFRLAFEDEIYIEQLLFHLNLPDRLACVGPVQAEAMTAALYSWVELHPGDRDDQCYQRQLDEIEQALGRLSAIVAR